MTKREEIQKNIKNTILLNNFKGIVLSSVRSGKTRIILETIKEHSKNKKITIFVAYPNIDVKNSWLDEMEKIQYFPNVIFSTFISLEKYINVEADYFIYDEAHLIPTENILPLVGKNCKK